MRISTDENIFKSSYFKNICPGYEQFFEPEKLFLQLSDNPAEIKSRQEILRDLLENPQLFEDLCFLSDAIIQFKSSFDDMPNHNLGDFRLNLECYEDADGAIGLINRFLKAAEYAKQYPWLSGFAEGIGQFAQNHNAEKMAAAWEQAFTPEATMHACDFGFNFDDILLPATYKLLSAHKDVYTRNSIPYQMVLLKPKYIDQLYGFLRNAFTMQDLEIVMTGRSGSAYQKRIKEDYAEERLLFDKNSVSERTSVVDAAQYNDFGDKKMERMYSDDYFMKIFACQLIETRSVSDAPHRIKLFITSLIAELEPLVTEFVPCLCAAKTALYWREKGIPYCIPKFGKAGEINVKGMINPYIAENAGVEATIENDVSLNDEIAVVTGANRGGKTAFVTSVTLCQILFQLGFPIPAKSANLGVFSGIVSVFAGEEQGLIGTGRLGEELKKLAEGLNSAREGNTFVCFNEPLTGTSSRDGGRILAEALCMLKEAGASGFVVTHLLGLAKSLDIINKTGGSPLVTLTAQTDGDKPLYKIIPAPVAETSHAKALIYNTVSAYT